MAAAAHQPVLMEVGVKSLGRPEFYPPPGVLTAVPDGGDVASDPMLRQPLLQYVRQTVLRYRSSPVLVGWQVENEPLNAAGPHRWWVDVSLLKSEMKEVRSLDRRPLVVNAFTHFNALFDRVSSAGGLSLAGLLGFQSNGAESQVLPALGRGDVLGLDVYTLIGYRILGQDGLSIADSDWATRAAQWPDRAQAQGADAWVTEGRGRALGGGRRDGGPPPEPASRPDRPDGLRVGAPGVLHGAAVGQRVLALALA